MSNLRDTCVFPTPYPMTLHLHQVTLTVTLILDHQILGAVAENAELICRRHELAVVTSLALIHQYVLRILTLASKAHVVVVVGAGPTVITAPEDVVKVDEVVLGTRHLGDFALAGEHRVLRVSGAWDETMPSVQQYLVTWSGTTLQAVVLGSIWNWLMHIVW